MDFKAMVEDIVRQGASDIFVISGLPITAKVKGRMIRYTDNPLSPSDTTEIVHQIYSYADNRDMSKLIEGGDDDFSFAIQGVSRFRVNTYKQRGTVAAVIRTIAFHLPHPDELNIPPIVMDICKNERGFVLVTGSAGSGKSTTLACMIDRINKSRQQHIITLEDPIEFLHSHAECIVSQREVNLDTESFVTALRSALRQSPDAILIGELRDRETIEVGMTAAETGHLVLSSLHTTSAGSTIDRIVDVFPPQQQQQIRLQLAMVLTAIVCQQLVPTVNGDSVPVFEVMTVNPAIKNLIRENKVHQIDNIISSASAADGMMSMDKSLLELLQKGIIDQNTALRFSANPEMMARKMTTR